MEVTATRGFLRHFSDMPDPQGVNQIHKVHDLIVIAVMAVICGADGWAQVAVFGQCKQKWLATFLELPGGDSQPRHVWPGLFAAGSRCV